MAEPFDKTLGFTLFSVVTVAIYCGENWKHTLNIECSAK